MSKGIKNAIKVLLENRNRVEIHDVNFTGFGEEKIFLVPIRETNKYTAFLPNAADRNELKDIINYYKDMNCQMVRA